LGVCVKIGTIVGCSGIKGFHAVLSVDVDHVDVLPMLGVLSVGPNGLHLVGFDDSDAQLIQHLKAAHGHSSPSGDGEDHGGEFLGYPFFLDFLADFVEVCVGFGDIEVFVGAVDVEEGSSDAHEHDVLSETLEEVDGACDAGITSEGDESVVVLVDDHFVVDEPDVAFEDGVEGRHVHGDSLVDVRETDVGFVWDVVVSWDLLHSKNHRAIRYVFIKHSPCVLVLGI
jgi:hypothetical protein